MTSERTPQDVLREDAVMARLSSANPKSRRHDEWRSNGRSMWTCVPIQDVVALRRLILAAIAEAPDSPPRGDYPEEGPVSSAVQGAWNAAAEGDEPQDGEGLS